MKFSLSFWVIGALAVLCTSPTRGDLVNSIQAVVHDTVITRQDVVEMTLPAVKVLQRQFRGQDEVIRKRLAEAERDNLETLTRRQLILHEFKTAGYAMPESVLDEMVEDRIRSRYGDRRTMAKTLQSEGITIEKLRERLREQFIVEAMRSKNISQEILISPQKIEKYYAAHKEDFKQENQVKLRMIVLPKETDPDAPRTDRLAQEILIKLKEGAAFDELSALYSQNPQRTAEGQWYETSGLRKELADAVAGLKAGNYSPVVELPDACYVLRVEEVKEEHYKPLTEVREEVERTLATEERDRLEKLWVDRLKKKTFVRYYP